MSPAAIFQIHLLLGYAPWLLALLAYGGRFAAMDDAHVQRAIATLHSFRFFGLVFILPGVVGRGLPADFATFAAWGDFATGVLAMLALASFRSRPLFYALVAAFNLVGAADILVDYFHGFQVGLAPLAGELGAGYAIVIVYVPLLMITHAIALRRLARALLPKPALQAPAGR